jgi:hypothetical protein
MRLPGGFSLVPVLRHLRRMTASQAAASAETLPAPATSTSSAALSSPVHLTVHLDINKTVVMSDEVQGKTLNDVVNDMLCESCWGRVHKLNDDDADVVKAAAASHELNVLPDGSVWIPDATLPVTSLHAIATAAATNGATIVNYADFVRSVLTYGPEGAPTIPAVKKRRKDFLLSFTDANRSGAPWRPLVDHITAALRSDTTGGDGGGGSGSSGSAQKPRLLVPAFYRMVDTLVAAQRNPASDFTFSLMFRTFGTDLDDVRDEFNAFCVARKYDGSSSSGSSGSSDDDSGGGGSGVIDLRLHSENAGVLVRSGADSFCVAFNTLDRPPKRDDAAAAAADEDAVDGVSDVDWLRRRWESLKTHLQTKTNTDADTDTGGGSGGDGGGNGDGGGVNCVELAESPSAIHKALSTRSRRGATVAISDDYAWWAHHGETADGGKLLLVDDEDDGNDGDCVTLQHVFFDDNILFDDANIVDVRSVSSSSSVSPSLSSTHWKSLQHRTLVKAEPLEVALNEEYFVEWLSFCSAAFAKASEPFRSQR